MAVRTSEVVPGEGGERTLAAAELLAATGARVRDSVRLAELTTLRVGGPATVAECASTESLVATVRALDAAGVPVLLLAGGSNLLVADSGFDGVVVRIATGEVELGADSVLAEAGADWDAVVAATVEAGLGGLECLSGNSGFGGCDAGAERRRLRRGGGAAAAAGATAGPRDRRNPLGRAGGTRFRLSHLDAQAQRSGRRARRRVRGESGRARARR